MGRILFGAAAVLVFAPDFLGQAPTADVLVQRASAYVTEFDRRFANVVSEEHYVQTAHLATTIAGGSSAGASGLSGDVAGSAMPGLPGVSGAESNGQAVTRRELRSDFLLVKVPSENRWLPFRDVFVVDGKPVRDRQERLTKLFLQPPSTAIDEAGRIAAESARYNLGNVARNINVPVLALEFLEPANLHRSRFRLLNHDRRVGPDVWVLAFDEVLSPALIHGAGGRDLKAKGRFWIDATSGRVLRAALTGEDADVLATVETDFRLTPQFGVAIPVEMREKYVTTDRTSTITGRATYTNFRRFNVTTSEVPKN